MEEHNKYYTPTLEEFHVGFEYEGYFTSGIYWFEYLLDKEDQKSKIGWTKKEVNKCTQLDAIEGYIITKRENPNYHIRVKYLDKEDIESLGWVYSKNGYAVTNGCLDLMNYIYFEKSNYFLIFNSELTQVTLFVKDVCKLEDCNHCPNLENFPIKNKSELKQLMKKLNII